MVKERVGLWLARVMLRATQNPELADACLMLPAIPRRQFALSAHPMDPYLSRILGSGSWVLWDQSKAIP